MANHPHLFCPYTMRSVTISNRIVVSPMCQYSATDGLVNDWHFVHLGSRAIGGAGLVLTEAISVSPEGRLSPDDLGLWSDSQIAGLERVVKFMNSHGAAAGIQLGHAGRKAGMVPYWKDTRPATEAEGGWTNVLAPSAIPFNEDYPKPAELSLADIKRIQGDFRSAAHRALEAGFQVIELHAAHGYIFHQFLSSLSNQRDDTYGGSFENRTRFLKETLSLVREVWPDRLPLFVRVSATDWLEFDETHSGSVGWTFGQTLELARQLRDYGVDLLDVSSGGNVPKVHIPIGPGYQTGFAARVREVTEMPTGAVGMISAPEQADHIIRTDQADLVLLGRELLRNPYWPLWAAQQLKQEISWPVQYERSASGHKPRRQPLKL